MLVACRLAGLSALGAHTMRAVNDAQRGGERRAEIARAVERVTELTPQGWADRGAGVPPPPMVQEKRRVRAAEARRNRRGFCTPSAPSRHGGQCAISPFEHFGTVA